MITSLPVWANGFPVAGIQNRFLFPFAGVTSLFAFLSAAAHFIVLICFKKYIADLRAGINVFRWYEYAASSSLMIVLMCVGRARVLDARVGGLRPRAFAS